MQGTPTYYLRGSGLGPVIFDDVICAVDANYMLNKFKDYKHERKT